MSRPKPCRCSSELPPAIGKDPSLVQSSGVCSGQDAGPGWRPVTPFNSSQSLHATPARSGMRALSNCAIFQVVRETLGALSGMEIEMKELDRTG